MQVKDLQNILWLNGPPKICELWHTDLELCEVDFDPDGQILQDGSAIVLELRITLF